MSHNGYCFVDIETTGLDLWRNEIIEIGTIISDKDFKVLGRYQSYIKPENLEFWSDEAEKTHKISKDKAIDFKDNAFVFNDWYSFVMDNSVNQRLSFVCHALPFRSSIDLFDRNFVFAWFWNNERRAEYYQLFPDKHVRSTITKQRSYARSKWGLENQKLSTWAKKLNINFNHHSAMDDTEMCFEVFKYQKGTYGQDESNKGSLL